MSRWTMLSDFPYGTVMRYPKTDAHVMVVGGEYSSSEWVWAIALDDNLRNGSRQGAKVAIARSTLRENWEPA